MAGEVPGYLRRPGRDVGQKNAAATGSVASQPCWRIACRNALTEVRRPCGPHVRPGCGAGAAIRQPLPVRRARDPGCGAQPCHQVLGRLISHRPAWV